MLIQKHWNAKQNKTLILILNSIQVLPLKSWYYCRHKLLDLQPRDEDNFPHLSICDYNMSSADVTQFNQTTNQRMSILRLRALLKHSLSLVWLDMLD